MTDLQLPSALKHPISEVTWTGIRMRGSWEFYDFVQTHGIWWNSMVEWEKFVFKPHTSCLIACSDKPAEKVGAQDNLVLSVMMLFWLVPLSLIIEQHRYLFSFQNWCFVASFSNLSCRLLCNWKHYNKRFEFTQARMLKRGWKNFEFWKENIAGSFQNLIKKDSVTGSSAFHCIFN